MGGLRDPEYETLASEARDPGYESVTQRERVNSIDPGYEVLYLYIVYTKRLFNSMLTPDCSTKEA